MKALALITLLSIGFGQLAAASCVVFNYKQAINCIKADANERFGEGELPHSVGATKYAQGKEYFERITGVEPTEKYVGVVEVHYSEDELLYYQISRGLGVEAQLVKQLNIMTVYETEDLAELENGQLEKVLSLDIPLEDSMEDFHFN